MARYEKAAEVLVEEIGSVPQLEAMLELGHRMVKLGPEIYGTFGIGCGGGCDAWGIACGNNCLQGLRRFDEVVRARFAIDVLGEKGLTAKDMGAIHEDFHQFGQAVSKTLVNRLSFDRMDERIAKYGG